MIKHLFVSFALICFYSGLKAQWSFVGGPRIGMSKYVSFPENPNIESDSSGNVYIAYIDDYTGEFYSPILVKKFNGSNWVNLAKDSLYKNLPFYSFECDFTIGKNNEMVLGFFKFNSGPDTTSGIFVYKFNGTYWEPIGKNGLVDSSLNFVKSISVKLSDSGTPSIAYLYSNTQHGSYHLAVKKFTGNNWVDIGMQDTIIEYSPYAGIYPLELLLSKNDTIIIHTPLCNIYKFNGQKMDSIGNAQKIYLDTQKNIYSASVDTGLSPSIILKKYIGSNWNTISNSFSGSINKIDLVSFYLSANTTPYVAYTTKQQNELVVANFNGSKWVKLGSSIPDHPYNAQLHINRNGQLYIRANSGMLADSIYRYVMTYSPGAGFTEIKEDHILTLYPNPIKTEMLHLQIQQGILEEMRLEVTDVSGKRILSQAGTAQSFTEIDIHTLNKGLYFASIFVGEKLVQVVKFCKQ